MPQGLDVVGIGSCSVDFFAMVPRLLGANEKMNAERLTIHPGGLTANNLAQVARLGAKAAWLGLIGDDENGRIIQKAFTDEGMDISGVEVVKGERSSFTWIPVNIAGDHCVYMFPNVTGKISVLQVRNRFASFIQRAKHFHTEASQICIGPVKEAMRIARDANVRVFFDLDVTPNFFAQANLGRQDEVCDCMKLVNVLKPSKRAARELTGESDYERIANRLLNLGPEIIALNLGPEGSLIATRTEKVHVPAFRVDVVDSAWSGAAFMGGLSYGLLQGWDLQRIAVFANACSALCCMRMGSRGMSKRDEVLAFIKSKNVVGMPAFA
jgi:sugar/nucleoside kinase (ribokinase family)